MNKDEIKLRQLVRQAIRVNQNRMINEQKKEINEENKLRMIIRKLLSEVAEDQPKHDSTGINVLEDLLKKIIPVIQTDFKILTTSREQRDSFRAHMLNAVQNSLSTEYMYAVSGADKLAEAVTITDLEDNEDQDKFIDINKDKEKEAEEKKAKEESPEAKFSKGLEGETLDTTGRNMAMQTYKKIERAIAEAYSLLDDKKDRSLFYDYLITNLKLYFDKFEEEMLASPEAEPTTPEYEKEKQRKSDEDTGTAEPLDM
jgi:hypothetical protein